MWHATIDHTLHLHDFDDQSVTKLGVDGVAHSTQVLSLVGGIAMLGVSHIARRAALGSHSSRYSRIALAHAVRFAAFAAMLSMPLAGQTSTPLTLKANTAVGFTRIRAPFDGLVVAKLADAGALAAPGVPLLTIEDPNRFRLEAVVDESQIGAVCLGETVPVVIDSLGDQTISGKVVQIVPMADPASRTFTVKVDLPANPQIRSGLFGRVRFARGERESILVPQNALLHRGQLDGVYVVGKDKIASLRYVTLGKLSANQIEVLSGLENGERIVAQPGERELSGKQIEVK